jgi:hypothetical protein
MRKVAIIARLKDGCEAHAADLLDKGPPFDPHERRLESHTAYLSAGEVMFIFERVRRRRDSRRDGGKSV